MEIIATERYTLYVTTIDHAGSAQRCVAERAAVAFLMAAALPGAVLRHDEHGAPFIVEGEGGGCVHISISHSRNYAVLAVSVCAMGVDVEEDGRSRQLERVSARFLRGDDYLNNGGFLAAWTAKEAVFKAAGIPTAVLSDIRLTHEGDASLDGRRFALFSHRLSDALITVAL